MEDCTYDGDWRSTLKPLSCTDTKTLELILSSFGDGASENVRDMDGRGLSAISNQLSQPHPAFARPPCVSHLLSHLFGRKVPYVCLWSVPSMNGLSTLR